MEIVEKIADMVDLLAVCVLLAGLVISVISTLKHVRRIDAPLIETATGEVLCRFRISLGRWLLVALEVLIVSDILHSIAHRTLQEVAFLAGIVVIRTTLSYFLDLEIERMERRQSVSVANEDPLR
ncbi:DUF1622 domain-containing protein [Labrenzia sp. OB1]|uniref:DUF1622 domain-containing protein n=1 Tax=Labrenzia sp. OB1 TaxID=1561204 RepID=UPI000838833A|nr:DUF1622 domain-containing protein [Labrenzia sp. OB1]